MARKHNWTSISVYATVKERIEELREGQSYNELLHNMCKQYDPDRANHGYEYEPTQSEQENSKWETISLHQTTYDEINSLKQEGETFNDLFIKMVRQYEKMKSTQ